jgi:hypothetical protein
MSHFNAQKLFFVAAFFSIVTSISALAGGVNPKAKPLGCDRPLGWHTPPNAFEGPEALIEGSNSVVPTFQVFIKKFSQELLAASKRPGNKAVRYELEKMNHDLLRYGKNFVEVDDVLYPKTESVLGAASLLAMNYGSFRDRMGVAQSRKSIEARLAEFEFRSRRIFRPNLLTRALRDWKLIVQLSPTLPNQKMLLRVLGDLSDRISYSLTRKTRPDKKSLKAWSELFDEAVSLSAPLRRARGLIFAESDRAEAQFAAETDARNYSGEMREMMIKGFFEMRLKMIESHRSENVALLGAPLPHIDVLGRLETLALELLANYSNDVE